MLSNIKMLVNACIVSGVVLGICLTGPGGSSPCDMLNILINCWSPIIDLLRTETCFGSVYVYLPIGLIISCVKYKYDKQNEQLLYLKQKLTSFL